MIKRNILVTQALPYANGALHLGHLVGAIYGDIWVRLQKMLGNQCLYICGSDSHGTPIMIQAENLQITPETLVNNISQQQFQDFASFLIEFDHYHSTHSPENRELVNGIFKQHYQNNNIVKRTIKQLFDPVKKIFLPDRYVKGTCPRCGFQDQYGDNCEKCGAIYLPTELIRAYSTLSGATPITKETEHYFFKLPNYTKFLMQWIHTDQHIQPAVMHKLDEWFKAGLKEWDISRDAPYFGFIIPGETAKYFYVWLDAPIGYMANIQHLCKQKNHLHFATYWGKKHANETELYHFIGKDIIYFHALFWPALLEGAQYRTPSRIIVHGFLTIDGKKMSKSRGTLIQARTYLKYLPPESLRYYFATKLNNHIDDLDLQLDDLIQRVNSDLIGKFINIASRCARFLNQYFENTLSAYLIDPTLFNEFCQAGDIIQQYWDRLEYSHATRHIMLLADRANYYIDQAKPWMLIKQTENRNQVHHICSMGINLFRLLMIYMKPVLPETAQKVEYFLNIPPLQWPDKNMPLCKQVIRPFKPLLQRIDAKQVDFIKRNCHNAS